LEQLVTAAASRKYEYAVYLESGSGATPAGRLILLPPEKEDIIATETHGMTRKN